jgi:epoxyqueuosine reductase
MTFTQRIHQKAADLGFDSIGITPADPLEAADFYVRWLALGCAGEMTYLERNREKRADPAQLVPGARSVICLGMDYYQETPEKSDCLAGRISCYARGDDYHDLIKKRLFALWEFIQQEAGREVNGRVYVDTAPVLERELANRAGLGWWGKNTCLINKKKGSFFFLAEVILDLDLDYDQPATDHCGSCTRCLDVCPTGALPEPYLLDARRCISYLTIELKGAIPRDLRPGIGDWIFGCDICQDVCPWNRKAAPATEPAFQGRSGLTNPSLSELLAMDRDGFNAHFRRHPAKRAKRRGLLRNAAVALGNSGDPAAVPPLVAALRDEEPLVRAHAAWGLGQLGGDEARIALDAALQSERDPDVIEEIHQALGDLSTD